MRAGIFAYEMQVFFISFVKAFKNLLVNETTGAYRLTLIDTLSINTNSLLKTGKLRQIRNPKSKILKLAPSRLLRRLPQNVLRRAYARAARVKPR